MIFNKPSISGFGRENKAQIGYSYGGDSAKNQAIAVERKKSPSPDPLENELEEDLDLQVDIKLLTSENKHILNQSATSYGMDYGDFVRMLTLDFEEKEELKRSKLLEAEKAQYSVHVKIVGQN